jgi:hypothetical protein
MRRVWQVLLLALMMTAPRSTEAEWLIKPFAGVTFAPSTTYLGDWDNAAGSAPDEAGAAQLMFGASTVLLGEIFGIEADFGRVPGFFERDVDVPDVPLVVQGSSSVLTLTGNVVVAVPRRIAAYALRPYFAAGFGLIRARSEDQSAIYPIKDTLPAIDFGGGATGFFSDRVGVSWDLRHFRAVGGDARTPAVTIDGEAPQLSFWRANMALVLRY